MVWCYGGLYIHRSVITRLEGGKFASSPTVLVEYLRALTLSNNISVYTSTGVSHISLGTANDDSAIKMCLVCTLLAPLQETAGLQGLVVVVVCGCLWIYLCNSKNCTTVISGKLLNQKMVRIGGSSIHPKGSSWTLAPTLDFSSLGLHQTTCSSMHLLDSGKLWVSHS